MVTKLRGSSLLRLSDSQPEFAGGRGACIVDEDVEPAERLDGLGHQPCAIIGPADVCLHRGDAAPGGAATIPALGARYTGIEARMALGGDQLTVEEAHLKGGSGTLRVTGDVRFEVLTRPVLNLALTASGFAAFTQRDFAGLTASGELRLTGPVAGATLTGRLVVDAGFLAFILY